MENNNAQENAAAIELSKAVANNFVTVKVRASRWTGTKRDKRASAALEATAGASAGAYSATKRLLVGADADLKTLNAAITSLRDFIYAETAPFGEAGGGGQYHGPRLLPATRSLQVLADADAKVNEINNSLLPQFLSTYDDARAHSIRALGSFADGSDYPTAEQLRTKFDVAIDVSMISPADAVPSGAAIPRSVLELAASSAAEQHAKGLIAAQRDTVDNCVKHLRSAATIFAKKADGSGGRLHGSTIKGIGQHLQRVEAIALGDIRLLTAARDAYESIEKALSPWSYDPTSADIAALSSYPYKCQRVSEILARVCDQLEGINPADLLPATVAADVSPVVAKPQPKPAPAKPAPAADPFAAIDLDGNQW